jgi:molybdenum cofactor biosynthesis protein B
MPRATLSNPVVEHRRRAAARATVAVVTLSTSRSRGEDTSGDLIQELLEAGGHTVGLRTLIPDSGARLRAALRAALRRRDIQAVITTGGTGLSSTDVTIETLRPMFEREIPGFTSLFMFLSYGQARSAAMLSRATAGVIRGKPVFCLPGSPRACRLAVESLILPELGHLLMILGS